MSLTILLVEPEESLREKVRAALRESGHRVWAFATADSAADSLGDGDAEPALALLTAGEDRGMDRLIDTLMNCETRCQRVWISPPGGDEVDRLAAARQPRGLLSRSALEEQACLLADRVWTTRERGRALVQAPEMVGNSPAMLETRTLIDRVAVGGATTVLITGESGTGKEVTARRLHALGPRAHGPFVEVDCASIPANLMESELFGHEAGAFTDARGAKAGLLELAQGGTAFLDEIGELEIGLQAKLLRVLDSRRMRRLGGRDEIQLDVHLVAATNRDLAREVGDGNFRADLYYRLDVVRVELPPVRDRKGDALLLARNFLEEAVRKLGRTPLRFSPEVEAEIAAYHWPGNVREIRNLMERLTLLAKSDVEVIEDLGLVDGGTDPRARLQFDFSHGPLSWELIETAAIRQAVAAAGGNVSEAARLLEMGRGALRYRMTRLGLDADGNPRNEARDEDREAA